MSVIGRREAILATEAAGIGSLFAEKRHEFIPLRDPLASLKEVVVLCDI